MMRLLQVRLTLIFCVLLLASCAGRGSGGDGVDFPSTSRIEKVWSVDVDQRNPADPAGFSQPAVVKGPAPGEVVVVAGRDGRVRTYDLKGREISRISLDEASDSGALSLHNGLVVVGDVDGKLYAVDPVGGHIVWKVQLSAPFLSQPVLLDDGFLVQTMDNRIYRFNDDGIKRWSFAGQGGVLSMYMSASPMMLDGVVYAVFSNGDAVAVKADSGDLLWRRQLLLNTDAAVLSELRAPISQPVHLKHVAFGTERAEDALLISFYQGQVLLLSKQDGSQLFVSDISLKSSPLLLDGRLYMAAANGQLTVIDLDSGATLWQLQLSEGELIGPVVRNNDLWLADDRGMVFRLNKQGDKRASIQIAGRVDRNLVVTSAGVLVRSSLGTLTLLR